MGVRWLSRLWSRSPAPELAENQRLVDAYEALEARERFMMGRLADNAFGIKQRPIHVATRWQPYHRDEIREECEQGQLLRLGFLLDAMKGDGMISGLLDTRTSGMLRRPALFRGDPFLVDLLRGREPTVDPATGEILDPGELGLWPRMVPTTEFAKVMRDGILSGVGLGELVCDERGLRCLRHLPIHWLRYHFGEDRWLYQSPNGTYEVRPGDGRWVLFTPYGAARPWIEGKWYPLAWPFISKAGTALDRLRWQGFLADPLRVIKSSKQSNEMQRKNLLRFILERWHRAPALVTKDDEQAYLVESNGRGFEVYNDSDDRADRDILYVLSGQTVTGDGNKGFNSLEGFDSIRLDIIQGTAAAAAECAVRDILIPWAQYYWGMGPDSVSVAWDVRSAAQRQAEAEALQTTLEVVEKADAVLERRGLETDIAAMVAQHGLVLPTRPISRASSAAKPIRLLSPGTVGG